MPHTVKRIFTWIFWIFVLYAILTSPNRAADLVGTVWEILVTGFNSIGLFFDRLLGHV